MKKLLAVLLTLIMLMGLSTTAFAAEGTTERTYKGYKLLDLSISLKEDEHHPADCPAVDPTDPTSNHLDSCYNYTYTINADRKNDYFPILQKETWDDASIDLWENNVKPNDPTGVSEDNVIHFLENRTKDGAAGYGSIRAVVEKIYDAIKENDLDEDVTITTGQNYNLEEGYWLFVDVTDLANKDDANSLIIVTTKGDKPFSIEPKVSLPTLEKKVKDIDDTESGDILNEAWVDSADHDKGDAVPFKLTATLPADYDYYDEYALEFHDQFSEAFTLSAIPVKVLLYHSKESADMNKDMKGGIDVTDSFNVVKTPTDNCSFEVSCSNVKNIKKGKTNTGAETDVTITSSSVFVVYYEAIFGENEFNIGEEGNENKAYLKFSNDPYNTDKRGQTKEDLVRVFTFELQIDKIDEAQHPLKGAEFTLYKLNSANNKYETVVPGTVDATGTKFTWTGIDNGEYKLVESTVPDGYNEMDPVEFTIYSVHDAESDDPKLTLLRGTPLAEGDYESGVIYQKITNKTGTILPNTGATGTMLLIGGGSAVAMLAAIFMITRKKMSIYED